MVVPCGGPHIHLILLFLPILRDCLHLYRPLIPHFRNYIVIFHFGFEVQTMVLIASVPGYCLYVTTCLLLKKTDNFQMKIMKFSSFLLKS